MTEFHKEKVIDRVPCVSVKHPKQDLEMPPIHAQIVENTVHVANEHGCLDAVIEAIKNM